MLRYSSYIYRLMFSIDAPIGFCGRAQYPKNMFTTYYIVLLSVNQKTSKHVKDDYTKSSVKTYKCHKWDSMFYNHFILALYITLISIETFRVTIKLKLRIIVK